MLFRETFNTQNTPLVTALGMATSPPASSGLVRGVEIRKKQRKATHGQIRWMCGGPPTSFAANSPIRSTPLFQCMWMKLGERVARRCFPGGFLARGSSIWQQDAESEVDEWRTNEWWKWFFISPARRLRLLRDWSCSGQSSVVYAFIKSRYITHNISLIRRNCRDMCPCHPAAGPSCRSVDEGHRAEPDRMTRPAIRRYYSPDYSMLRAANCSVLATSLLAILPVKVYT